MLCDLHTHSVYSDGTLTPAELISEAEKCGLCAVALCDHNTASGLPEFLKAAEKSKVEAICGVEFSTEYKAKELHILALFVSPDKFGAVQELAEAPARLKEISNVRLAEALADAGYPVDYEKIKASTPDGRPNRAHFAREMTELGYTASVKEAFDKFLDPKAGYYDPPRRLDALETVEFIRGIGAVPVIAHPFLNLGYEELIDFLPKAKAHGLCGMEVLYSEYDGETEAMAFELADRFGLLYSGGSDFHGETKPHIALGKGKGQLKIPYEYCDKLRSSVTYE